MAKPSLMGILNVTPDSFYAPSCAFSIEEAIQCGIQMYRSGADILDVGGESTRPGAQPLSAEEELNRVAPVVAQLAQQLPIPLSIDTRSVKVAEACIALGARLLNLVGGCVDSAMREVAASTGVDLCIMHMQGTPTNMQKEPTYPEGVIDSLLGWFDRQIELLLAAGVKPEQIIVDPGIGFGKTVAHNVEILQNLARFRATGFRVLIGVSRKSFMSKILGLGSEALLPATLAVNALLLSGGVEILRVHDVAEHRQLIDVLNHVWPSLSS